MNLGLYHLARQPLESLLESLRTVQRLTQQGKNEPTSAITGQMLTSGRQLLRSRPRFALNRLSVTEPAFSTRQLYFEDVLDGKNRYLLPRLSLRAGLGEQTLKFCSCIDE